MELRKPRYSLQTLQELIRDPKNRIITRPAHQGAYSLGFDEKDIVDCVLALQATDFYKSMTTTATSKLWQDVYKPTFREHKLYVKLQLAFDGRSVVVSFKGDDSHAKN